ncbi:NF038143 family protein [Desulfonatronum thiodismutans]|uniref:NF038143 family protein n=1 Tax=Desulfonatronum thiodismutans TaxID=159290 RepID=UPI0004ABE29C|nr:NF038143 family protein [Desulfonatronum thiodismutans]
MPADSESKLLKAQLKAILTEEREFASRVVYYRRADTQSPWWYNFIPFKFLVEYFGRKKETTQFSQKHLRFKETALRAAEEAVRSGNAERARQEMKGELREFWMREQKLESREVYENLSAMMDLLLDHYLGLLQTREREYLLMLRRAYQNRAAYQEFLARMEQVEHAVDQGVVDALGKTWPDPYIQSKQKAIRDVRKRELEDAF